MIPWHELSKEQRIERWQNVRRVVKAIADDPHARAQHWDMSLWGRVTPCGTVACAGGHCALDPWFNSQGLKARRRPGSDDSALEIWDGEHQYWTGYGWRLTLMKFFGEVGSNYIFNNSTLRPPGSVLSEIDLYLSTLV